MNFVTGLYVQDELESRPGMVAKRYLKSWLLPDVLIVAANAATWTLGGASPPLSAQRHRPAMDRGAAQCGRGRVLRRDRLHALCEDDAALSEAGGHAHKALGHAPLPEEQGAAEPHLGGPVRGDKSMASGEGKPTLMRDVAALSLLPKATQRKFRVELCAKHLRHPLLRRWLLMDALAGEDHDVLSGRVCDGPVGDQPGHVLLRGGSVLQVEAGGRADCKDGMRAPHVRHLHPS